MNAKRLSERERQPGNDRSFVKAELDFINAARKCLDVSTYDVEPQPNDLRNLFKITSEGERALGVVFEAVIINKKTKRRLYVEVKKQGDNGNADERACKHHTVQFYKTMKDRFNYKYHPVITIMCEALAINPRYTRKSIYYFEPDQYFNWVDYDIDKLCRYLTLRCKTWLE